MGSHFEISLFLKEMKEGKTDHLDLEKFSQSISNYFTKAAWGPDEKSCPSATSHLRSARPGKGIKAVTYGVPLGGAASFFPFPRPPLEYFLVLWVVERGFPSAFLESAPALRLIVP